LRRFFSIGSLLGASPVHISGAPADLSTPGQYVDLHRPVLQLPYDAMRSRWGALLLMLYIALEFGTPMMGAVQFLDDGSIETDAGLCARRARDPAPAVTPLLPRLSAVASWRKPTLPAGRVECACPPAPVLFRVLIASRSTPASSPNDD